MAVIVSTFLSSVLLLFSTGLHPLPWLTWLAPLPVLWLAPRAGARVACCAAGLAWLLGQSRMWPYFLDTLEMPLPAAGAVILGQALVFALLTWAYRRLLLNGRPLTAAAAVPAGWVTLEYVLSLSLPHGAWLSLAYTQASVLPVLQTASLTGPWGITFLVMGFPAALAVATTPKVRGRGRVLVVAAVVLALPLGYGTWRLSRPHPITSARVALLDTDRPNDTIDLATTAGRRLLDRYVTRIRALPRSTSTVVLPEKTFAADERTLPVLTGPLRRTAAEHNQDIVVGLVLDRAGTSYNAALGFRAHGGEPVLYFKHHLIPGAEGDLEPGGGLTFVAPGHGLIICKDLDFPALVRDYRNHGATALLAPAWDFTEDGWLHSRMALTRGVENGLTVARTSRAGRLTVSDSNGRVLAERVTGHDDFTTVTADLPTPARPTVYDRFGDWFAWLCMLLLVPVAIGRWRSQRSPGSPHEEQ
ncbi:apolipoprotein N-acyltransferase [Streptomyces pseudovenezuelae]|uniref:Apolipoprotein N-acyltransferase n=1 Tax=Streptomyces pseudovenezuelae TaxID=67350 RepID=A0ABT6M5B4_9ACTN|nr:nitrilase-related carbon-nitrogen hydrolase [Streptomyces pseudovenezuelae]MDH6222824.1 apolipoprotein N-acyltransferase [Streptomyces pseudovenezuelae]